jgi:hypothetical protein
MVTSVKFGNWSLKKRAQMKKTAVFVSVAGGCFRRGQEVVHQARGRGERRRRR